MKKPNFCAIFATMFVAATVIMLASCSQDDEFYEDGLFTRADEMMTRAGEPGGYTPTPTPPPVQKIAAGADTSYYRELFPIVIENIITWPEGYTSVTNNPVNPSLTTRFQDGMFINLDSGLYYEIKETTVQWSGAYGAYGIFTYEAKDILTDTVFRKSTIHFVETVEKVFLTD